MEIINWTLFVGTIPLECFIAFFFLHILKTWMSLNSSPKKIAFNRADCINYASNRKFEFLQTLTNMFYELLILILIIEMSVILPQIYSQYF